MAARIPLLDGLNHFGITLENVTRRRKEPYFLPRLNMSEKQSASPLIWLVNTDKIPWGLCVSRWVGQVVGSYLVQMVGAGAEGDLGYCSEICAEGTKCGFDDRRACEIYAGKV